MCSPHSFHSSILLRSDMCIFISPTQSHCSCSFIVTLFGTGDRVLSQFPRVLLRRHRGRVHSPFLIPHPAVIRHISNIWLNKHPGFITRHHSPSQHGGEINDWILHYLKQELYYFNNSVKTFVHVKLSSQHVCQINAHARMPEKSHQKLPGISLCHRNTLMLKV